MGISDFSIYLVHSPNGCKRNQRKRWGRSKTVNPELLGLSHMGEGAQTSADSPGHEQGAGSARTQSGDQMGCQHHGQKPSLLCYHASPINFFIVIAFAVSFDMLCCHYHLFLGVF